MFVDQVVASAKSRYRPEASATTISGRSGTDAGKAGRL